MPLIRQLPRTRGQSVLAPAPASHTRPLLLATPSRQTRAPPCRPVPCRPFWLWVPAFLSPSGLRQHAAPSVRLVRRLGAVPPILCLAIGHKAVRPGLGLGP